MKNYTMREGNQWFSRMCKEAEVEGVVIFKYGKPYLRVVACSADYLSDVVQSGTSLGSDVVQTDVVTCSANTEDKLMGAREELGVAEVKSGILDDNEDKRWVWVDGEQVQVTLAQWKKSGKVEAYFLKLPKEQA